MPNFPVWIKIATDGAVTLSQKMNDGSVLSRKVAEEKIEELKRSHTRHLWELVPTQRSFYQIRGYVK